MTTAKPVAGAEEVGDTTPVEVPLHMRRVAFDPAPELSAVRDGEGVREVVTTFGTPA